MLELLAVAVIIFAALTGIVWAIQHRGSRDIKRALDAYHQELARERHPSSRRADR